MGGGWSKRRTEEEEGEAGREEEAGQGGVGQKVEWGMSEVVQIATYRSL